MRRVALTLSAGPARRLRHAKGIAGLVAIGILPDAQAEEIEPAVPTRPRRSAYSRTSTSVAPDCTAIDFATVSAASGSRRDHCATSSTTTVTA
jgi:hypothetical protein